MDSAKQTDDSHSQAVRCEGLELLRSNFVAAFRELAELQSQQAEALLAHDPDFTRFDDLLYMARLAKDRAKYLLLAHLSEHGCQDRR